MGEINWDGHPNLEKLLDQDQDTLIRLGQFVSKASFSIEGRFDLIIDLIYYFVLRNNTVIKLIHKILNLNQVNIKMIHGLE